MILLILVAGRLVRSHGDFSYFIVAGTDFVNPAVTPEPLTVQQGQGYDGQFFYRYALDPFDFSQDKYGVHVDHPSYRHQRITYPLLAWLFSAGGFYGLVPIALLLVNVLSFFGILYYMRKLIDYSGSNAGWQFAPLVLCGLYMSIARDLSEVVELFFFTGAVYQLQRRAFLLFAVYASFTMLARETAVLALFPFTLLTAYYMRKELNYRNIGCLLLPFLLPALWKYIVLHQTGVSTLMEGTGNLGMPFTGIWQGFQQNADVSTTKNIFQLIFWLLYFAWQVIFACKVVAGISFRKGQAASWNQPLATVYLVWSVFALFLSVSVYADDWSFMRVLALWNMTGLIVMMMQKRNPGNYFMAFSVLLVACTIGRLILRV